MLGHPGDDLAKSPFPGWPHINASSSRQTFHEHRVRKRTKIVADVVREFQYWDWRYRMRSAAGKEIAPNALGDGEGAIYARGSWLEKKLEIIHPRTRQEAIDILKWYIDFPRFEDGNGDNVYLNLIGQHQVE